MGIQSHTESHKIPPEVMNAVISKLESLETEEMFVVSRLIDFLKFQRGESEIALSEAFMNLSSESLWKIWDNDEDAVYDAL